MRPTSRFIPNRIRLEVDPQAGEETGRLKRDAEIVIASSMKRDRNAVDGTWIGRRFFMVGGAESRVIIGCEADFWSRKPILKEERVRLMRRLKEYVNLSYDSEATIAAGRPAKWNRPFNRF